MKVAFIRSLAALAVIFWGVVICYFYASGRITKYLAPDFRTIALVGSLGLIVLGLFNLLTCLRTAPCGHDHSEGHDHDHNHSDLNPFVAFLLMVVPLALSFTWTKDSFSIATLSRKGLYDDAPQIADSGFLARMMPELTWERIEESHRRTSDGYLEFNLLELYFSAADPEFRKLLEGKKIQTEGRMIVEKKNNPNGTRKRLYRMFMTCCAADARAIPIILEFENEPPNLAEDGWIITAGEMQYPREEGVIRPVLKVLRATTGDSPREEKFFQQ